MPTEIDNLQIKINADAQKANNAIDVLVGKLDILTTSLGKIDGSKLTGLANGVSAFGNAVKLVGSVDKRNFDRLAENITKIASINTASINRAASSMNQLRNGLNSLGSVSQNATQISQVAANLSKLGGKNVTNAIANLPKLTVELNNFMSVMAKSPQVSQNIINMTNALANLAGQGRSVGATTKTLTNGLNSSNKAITRTSKSTLSLAAAFGKFYATYFLVLRGIKGLWSSIGKTADYFEAFNYFNVAFDKIANEWSQDYEKYGYKNAKAYADSFTDRMEDTFSKLSGVQFDTDKGLLSETGIKNLGLNIQELTQYASQLASVTNSLGLTGEASLATSSALTKLAGDMSSLFNIDYEQVSQNLTSGLLNSSRALYKYGIDVTSATLQTKAYELGLTKAVSEMEQSEKFQLKLLSVLEQSKVAWGDQANTINSLANQIRVLKNGWSEVGMVFGQLFVPMLEDALPVINGMVIALKRLLINVAGFMGVDIDPDKFNTGLNNNEEILDGITDGFEDATAAAKEYENQILGFDEITKLKDDKDKSGLGGSTIDLTQEILDATSQYEKAWNDAYNNMENRAEKWADKISEYFSAGNWFNVGEDASTIVTNIYDFFSNAIDNVDWNKLGNNVGRFLAGMNWFDILVSSLKFKVNIAKALAEAWFSSFDEAPIETALITAFGAMKFTGLGVVVADKIGKAISGSALANSIVSTFNGLGGIGGILSMDMAVVIGAGSLAEIGMVVGTGIIGGVTAAFVGYNIGEEIGEAINIEGILAKLGVIEIPTVSFSTVSEDVQIISQSISDLLGNIDDLRNQSKVELSNVLGTAEEIDTIAKAYFELADKSSLTADEQNLLIGYADRLIELMPELTGLIDEETGAYKAQKDEINNVIKAQKKKMLQELAAERQKELLEQIVDLELKQAEISGEVADAQERQQARSNQFEKDKQAILDEQVKLGKKLLDLQSQPANQGNLDAIRETESAIADLDEQLTNLRISYNNQSASDVELIKSFYAVENQIDALNTEYNNYSKAVETATDDMKLFAETVAGTDTEYSLNINVDTTEATTKFNNVFNLLGTIKSKTVSIGGDTSKVDSALNTIRNKLMNYELPTLNIKALIKTDLDEQAFNDAVEKMGPLGALSSNFFTPSIKSSLSVGSFASGGFVDSYSLFMAGENGVPEILGTVGGRTAVAGGAEITGIREEIRETASEEIALLRQQNNLLQQLLSKESGISYKDIGRATKRYATEYTMQTGKAYI